MKIVYLFLIGFLLSACSGANSNRVLEKSGVVENQEIIVSAETGGKLIRLLKDEGDVVRKGDTVAILDKETLELKLKQAEANLEATEAKLRLMKKGARKEDIDAAQGNVKQARAAYELAEKEFKRAEELLRNKSLSLDRYDKIKSEFEIAKARLSVAKSQLAKAKRPFRREEIRQAEAALHAAKAQVELLKKNVKDAVLVSPIDGTITKVFYKQGELVAPFGSVFSVDNLKQVEVRIYIPETQLGKVKVGQKVEIFSDSFSGKNFEGKVVFVSPKAEFTPKTIQTKEERVKLVYEVKIVAKNPDGELKTGMPVDVKIRLE